MDRCRRITRTGVLPQFKRRVKFFLDHFILNELDLPNVVRKPANANFGTSTPQVRTPALHRWLLEQPPEEAWSFLSPRDSRGSGTTEVARLGRADTAALLSMDKIYEMDYTNETFQRAGKPNQESPQEHGCGNLDRMTVLKGRDAPKEHSGYERREAMKRC
jgi:hypothetical protein